MKVWIVNPFDNLPHEGCRPQRYWLMARAFCRAGHTVTYLTSDFSHATKKPRAFVRPPAQQDAGIRLVLLSTRPYAANVCLRRVFSHRALARTFHAQADAFRASGETPDLVIASLPPLGLCAAALNFARACGARFVADIQDAWPETFERVIPRFALALLGMRRLARRIYCEADVVSSVARRYLDLARQYGSTAPSVFCGHAVDRTNFPPTVPRDGVPCRLAYAGNMSLSYDLTTVLRAVSRLPDVTLDLAGNGPDLPRLKRLAHELHLDARVRFHGYLGEQDLAILLASCDVGLIPMFPESCVGMPGKLADYAAAGLRILECLGGECCEQVARYKAGAHYQAGDVDSLVDALSHLSSFPAGDQEAFAAEFDATRLMDGYVAAL